MTELQFLLTTAQWMATSSFENTVAICQKIQNQPAQSQVSYGGVCQTQSCSSVTSTFTATWSNSSSDSKLMYV